MSNGTNGNGKPPQNAWEFCWKAFQAILHVPNGVTIAIVVGLIIGYYVYSILPSQQDQLETNRMARETMAAVSESSKKHSENDAILAKNQEAALRNHERLIASQDTMIRLLCEAFGVKPKDLPNHN